MRLSLGSRSDVRLLRKSQSFWNVLIRYGTFNRILRVPEEQPMKVKIETSLYEGGKVAAASYTSVDEFIAHVTENELNRHGSSSRGVHR